MEDFISIPDFDSLPHIPGMPQGCAWGIFDWNGKKDHLGCLNLLTPSVVRAAIAEASDGISVSLNWSMAAIHTPGFSRRVLVHKVIWFMDHLNTAMHLHGFDDEVEFNSQSSSQWDSLVHFNHQPTQLGYNGVQITKEGLLQPFGETDVNARFGTLDHWQKRGCLVGRGVLLDYKLFADAHNIKVDCFDSHKIHVEDLERVAAWQVVEFKQGDIIIIRTGYTEELAAAVTADNQRALLSSHRSCGVFGSVATAKWFWNKHPAAVASDAVAFEQVPPTRPDGTEGAINELVLHPYFLSLFGLNIGKLWDLKELSRVCKAKHRYSFLLTSAPLNVPGAVGSPPNAVAIL